MKKIIINVNILWGIIKFRTDLILYLRKRGFLISVIGAPDEFSTSTYSKLKELGIRYYPIKMNRKGLNPIQDFIYIFTLMKILIHERPDMVLNYTIKPNIYGSIACAITRINSIPTVNGLGSAMMNGGLLARALGLLFKLAFKFPEQVMFQNETDRLFFISRDIVESSKTRVIPGSGINTTLFHIEPASKQNRKLRFNLIGRMLKDKGVYEYIEAIRMLKDKVEAEFFLSGILDEDNPTSIAKSVISKWVEEGLVVYKPKTDNVLDYLQETDIVVLPSYREGLSKILLEAASCSKPIITTDVPGCRELISEPPNGYLCKPADARSLSEAIYKMINTDKYILGQMGKNSRAHVLANYDSKIINAMYFKYINSIVTYD